MAALALLFCFIAFEHVCTEWLLTLCMDAVTQVQELCVTQLSNCYCYVAGGLL
jgi:hypothetical protein